MGCFSLININKNDLPYWAKSDATLPTVVHALPALSLSFITCNCKVDFLILTGPVKEILEDTGIEFRTLETTFNSQVNLLGSHYFLVKIYHLP